MITLDQIVEASNSLSSKDPRGAHAMLFYGEPKTGKTTLAASIAMAPEIDRVFLFDSDKGKDAIITAYNEGRITKEALAKIILISISDTREDFNAIETMLKTVASKQPAWICDEHGKVNCLECKKANKPGLTFDYKSLTKRDVVVTDSLSQVGTSALNMACKGQPAEYKLTFDEYGAAGKWLSDFLTVVQACQTCIHICVTHVLLEEDEKDKSKKLYPLCGTRNFSMNCAKFFGTVVYLKKHMGKLKAFSGVHAAPNLMTGSRLGILLEKQSEVDLVAALREAGFLPPRDATESSELKAEVSESKPTVKRFGA